MISHTLASSVWYLQRDVKCWCCWNASSDCNSVLDQTSMLQEVHASHCSCVCVREGGIGERKSWGPWHTKLITDCCLASWTLVFMMHLAVLLGGSSSTGCSSSLLFVQSHFLQLFIWHILNFPGYNETVKKDWSVILQACASAASVTYRLCSVFAWNYSKSIWSVCLSQVAHWCVRVPRVIVSDHSVVFNGITSSFPSLN